jgi:cytoplasmic iron level regulating protein YaaA (DUF328/UPF0246 family)
MGSRLATARDGNLYRFWGDWMAQLVSERCEAGGEGEPVLVNLASAEYFRVLRSPRLRTRVVTPVFQDQKPGEEPKVIAPLAKYARGRMVRFMVEERLDRPLGLRDFNWDRYRFQAGESSGERLLFRRIFVPARVQRRTR